MRRRILLLVLLGGVTISLLFFFLYAPEPVYQGKGLSTWMDELTAQPPIRSEGENIVAIQYNMAMLTNVVRSIGHQWTAIVSKWIQDTPRPLSSDKFEELVERFGRGHAHLPQHRFRSIDGVIAFQILGPMAEPAIPELARILTNEGTCGEAARCLTAIGPAAVPALSNAVVTATNRVRIAAITALGELGPVAKPTVPLLIQIVRTGDPYLADFALRTLAEVETNADTLMPLLVERLADTNTALGAAYGLARVGTLGLPILLQALTNDDRKIRLAAGAASHPECSKVSCDERPDRFRTLRIVKRQFQCRYGDS